MSLRQRWSEFFPPRPQFTEKDLPSLVGKVYLITGGASGIGMALAKILYAKGAKVYITSRSEESGERAVSELKASTGSNSGEMHYLVMDLSDLETVVAATKRFISQETLLHCVWFNAGVMAVPKGSLSKDGYELHWGTNVVAHFLMNKLLMPLLLSTAQDAPVGSVRAVWVSSDGHGISPKPDGIDWEDVTTLKPSSGWKGEKSPMAYYGQSKAGNVLLAKEFARRYKSGNVVLVSLNPGHLRTGLAKHYGPVVRFLVEPLNYDASYGALTELYAGLSPDIELSYSGGYVLPWGRKGTIRSDIDKGFASRGTGQRLYDILDQQTQRFLL